MTIQTMNDLYTILLNDKERFKQLNAPVPFGEYEVEGKLTLQQVADV